MRRSPVQRPGAASGPFARASLLLLLGAAAVAACATLDWKPIGPRRTAEIEGAEPAGAEECITCHEDVEGHAKIAAYHSGCESCHGGGSLHDESEKVSDIRFPSNADCLQCHRAGRNTHLQWGTGQHSRAGVFCSDCHNPHEVAKRHLRPSQRSDLQDADAASRLCIECHEDIAAKLRYPSHHPVIEGAISCISCHDPHEDARVRAGDRNQVCAGCHQDTMGPWTFEHPPAAEDCTICHDPHGAVGDHLLATVQPVICLSCHPVNDLWHHYEFSATGIPGNTVCTPGSDPPCSPITKREAATFLDRCTDCHGAVHGSYTDAHLRH